MQYGIGDCLAESGFGFYERLHEPIFLISKVGKILKINKSGRKLLAVANLTVNAIEAALKNQCDGFSQLALKKTTVLKTRNQKVFLSASKLSQSDNFLIEVRR